MIILEYINEDICFSCIYELEWQKVFHGGGATAQRKKCYSNSSTKPLP